MALAARDTFPRSAAAKIAFYGCQVGEGGLVRVGLVDGQGKPPQGTLVVTCPRCGDPHHIRLTGWREPTGLDEGREPDLLVEPVPPAKTE